MRDIALKDRIRGAFWGAICGDALGIPVATMQREELLQNPIHEMRGFGTHNQPPGTWSSISSLILCTTNSLTKDGFSPKDIMSLIAKWVSEDYMTATDKRFDTGHATAEAISRFSKGKPREEWGCQNDWQNGCGALIRMFPVSLTVIDNEIGAAIEKSFIASSMTHAHIRSQLCCAYLTLILRFLSKGEDLLSAREKTSFELKPYIPVEELPKFERLLSANFTEMNPEDFHSSAYVMNCLESTMFCCFNSTSSKDAILKAVSLGSSTSTTASLTGCISGFINGFDSIPEEWIQTLARKDMIENIIEAFISKTCS